MIRLYTVAILVIVTCLPLHAQTTGTPTPLTLSGGSGTLTLDFTNNDYELILYSGQTDAADTTRTYSYTVSSGSTLSLSPPPTYPLFTTQQNHFEYLLRQKEKIFAQQIRTHGWTPSPKITQTQQIGSTRTFTFGKFGGVTSDRTVTATLVAENSRAIAYLDNALPASATNVSTAQIETMLNAFSDSTFGIITNAYGAPSDVDNDNKVLFLFTHLVDQVGGVAGFYSSGSLFATDRGGDGNIADMMFISPTREIASYKSLLAHEFQHLISFNQHVLVQNGDSEETWLNEGLSHVAEDLVDGHIDGGNADLVADFMNNPERYALTGDASLNSGIRGAAYLFVRGLIESFGADVPGRLVKTNQVNIANVENISGQTFDEVYRTFVSRLFLSGNNLNTDAKLNYSFKYFTESQTQKRSLPLPKEQKIDAQTTSVSGTVRPAASAFIRLTGTGSQNIQIQTDLSGNLRATYIALPKNFTPTLALPIDFFQKLTLDAPLSAVYTTGESVTFSGSVNDASITRILLTFEPRASSGEEIQFSIDVAAGKFSQSIIFAPSQAGEYTLAVYAGQQGQLLPQVGRFPGAIVKAGEGQVSLPTDFFTGITLSTPLPGQYQAGQGASLVGQTTDSGIEVLLLVFTPKAGGTDIRIQTSVSNGAFRKGFIFTPEQAGTYDLSMFGGASGGSLPHLGGFSPVVVTSTGSESINLPVDIFDNVVLSTPLNTTFVAGQTRRISGTVSNATITQVAISFSPTAGGSDIDKFVSVNSGQFTTDIAFTDAQVGQYNILLFGGQAGQSLPSLGTFTPITVVTARPVITLAKTSLTWSDVSEGQTQNQTLSITNSGSQTLTISSFVTKAPFSVSQTTLSIAPGETGTATVIFAPTSGGTHSGTLQILNNDPDRGTQIVSLSGTAISVPRPIITLRQNTLTYPSTLIGQTKTQTVTVVNSGKTNLTVTPASNNELFTLSTTPLTIAPSDSATITVTFTPTAAGTTTGTITLTTNDTSNPSLTITLTATATAQVTTGPTSPDFNGDGSVGFADFLAFAGAFGSKTGDSNFDSKFDLNSDGNVGFPDFLTFAAAFGKPL